MNIFIERTNEEKDIQFNGTVEELLSMLAINPEEVLVSCNDQLVTVDSSVGKTDTVKILSIISGG